VDRVASLFLRALLFTNSTIQGCMRANRLTTYGINPKVDRPLQLKRFWRKPSKENGCLGLFVDEPHHQTTGENTTTSQDATLQKALPRAKDC